MRGNLVFTCMASWLDVTMTIIFDVKYSNVKLCGNWPLPRYFRVGFCIRNSIIQIFILLLDYLYLCFWVRWNEWDGIKYCHFFNFQNGCQNRILLLYYILRYDVLVVQWPIIIWFWWFSGGGIVWCILTNIKRLKYTKMPAILENMQLLVLCLHVWALYVPYFMWLNIIFEFTPDGVYQTPIQVW